MFRRYALQSALALVAVTALGACATRAPAPQTLAETVAKTSSLQTFNTLVAEAGMTETLKAAGPYTVFAPSDAAFKAVPAKTLDALKADKALLKSVLSYHIVPSRMASKDVKPGNVKTLEGATIALARAGNFVTVEEAMVEQADIAASNGVVHVVEGVLIPPEAKSAKKRRGDSTWVSRQYRNNLRTLRSVNPRPFSGMKPSSFRIAAICACVCPRARSPSIASLTSSSL